jgi:hypothetical protein
MGQLLAHLCGDYLLQSHWMATEKTSRSWPAAAHAICYALAFLALTRSVPALLVIGVSHFVIDRWRLARYVVWAKNRLAPRRCWGDVTATGYPEWVPAWLATWLLIVADNTLHLGINALALRWWG